MQKIDDEDLKKIDGGYNNKTNTSYKTITITCGKCKCKTNINVPTEPQQKYVQYRANHFPGCKGEGRIIRERDYTILI